MHVCLIRQKVLVCTLSGEYKKQKSSVYTFENESVILTRCVGVMEKNLQFVRDWLLNEIVHCICSPSDLNMMKRLIEKTVMCTYETVLEDCVQTILKTLKSEY